MATLIIRKVLGGIWEHEPSDAQLFILSNWYVKVNVPYFQLQEIGGSQRKIYLISQITVFDINGGPETFANFTALMVRLKALDYTAFEQGSGGGGGVVINDNTPSLTEVYSSQKVEDSFVPLSGTAESFPITGILKFKNGESNAEIENNADDGLQIKSTLDGRNKQGLALINVSQVYLSINDFDNQFNSALNLVHEELSLSLSKASAKGLKGDQDFTANYPTDGSEDKIFPQIKYVKDKFQRLPRLVNANTTALNNEILHVTADATITDIVGAVAGNFFTVRVLGGVATVGGVDYSAGNIIKRSFNGTDWISRVYINKAIIDATYQVLDSDFLITANTILSAIHNGKTLYIVGFRTITIPSILPNDFKCCFKTKLGGQITWAITAPFAYAYGTPTATVQNRDALITRELGTNNIYITTN